MILLNFLVHCWNLNSFIGITNALGKFTLMKDDHMLGFEHVSLGVLVEMEVHEGFLAELEVLWEGRSFVQRLEY